MKDFKYPFFFDLEIMKKGLILAFAFVLLFISAVDVRAAMCVPGSINVMAVDGYVDDTTGARLQGAYVLGTTTCSMPATNNRVVNGLTYPGGYYTVFNLPLGPGANAIMTANYTHPTYGQGFGIKNIVSGGTVENINITVCYPPSAPVIVDEGNTHFTVVQFDWSSGSDPVGYSTYDEFVINGARERASPGLVKNLAINQNYNWGVRTCNEPPTGQALNDVFCCSALITDSFSTGNFPPGPPNLTGTSSGGVATLFWISGIDPEGDPIYDQFRFVGGNIIGNITNPAISPVTVPAELLISFEVRTCDNFNACSVWVRADVVTCPVTTPSVCPPTTGGGGRCTLCIPGNFTVTQRVNVARTAEIYCDGVKQDAGMVTKVEFKTSGEGVKLVAYGDNYAVEGAEYCPSCYDGKQDGDETGVDCGGTCKACPGKIPFPWFWFWIVVALATVILLLLYAQRQNLYLWMIYKHIVKGRGLLGLNKKVELIDKKGAKGRVIENKESKINEKMKGEKHKSKMSEWFNNLFKKKEGDKK